MVHETFRIIISASLCSLHSNTHHACNVNHTSWHSAACIKCNLVQSCVAIGEEIFEDIVIYEHW